MPAALRAQTGPDTTERLDAIIIGAGIAGMYQLHNLRQLGMRVRVFETGTGVGGTWYWNRYPGARFDSESWTYGYAFSEELLQEWNWKEHFSAQPDTLQYLNYVADKFDLRRDIRFNSRVAAARFDEAEDCWEVEIEGGERFRATFLITALGPLSAYTLPRIPGVETFQGQSCHTARWPKEPVSFEGKRVAVIGTGATGIQTIQTVARTVGHLTVFQRTPNWAAPLHNRPITEEEMRDIKARYPEIFARCRVTPGCFIHMYDPRSTFDVTDDEREAFYEKLYGEPGFGIWQGNFRDMSTDPAANALATDFIAGKIRQRVKDPAIAEKLIPKNHGFGTRRVPLETGYYEVYNQDNVELVDLRETPIERITPKGIKTTAGEYAFDMIIYATGFDAVTGGVRPDRHPRARRQAAAGQVGGGAADVSRSAVRGLPQHADPGWAAQCRRPLQHSALHRAECGMGHGPDALHARQGPDLYRDVARGRGRVDGEHQRAGQGHAVHERRFLDDRNQQQRRGQEHPPRAAISGRRARLPGALRRGGGGGVPGVPARVVSLRPCAARARG